MSVSNAPSARSLFKLLAGTSNDLTPQRSCDVVGILKSAHPAVYAGTLKNFQRCTTRFAAACQRYEEGPKSLKSGLSPRFMQPEYLTHMGQAMPYGVLMPVYFHNARWPFQFAKQDEARSNPYGNTVLSAMAQLRAQQAMLLRQMRHAKRKPNLSSRVDGCLAAWLGKQVADNYALLRPLEPVRHTFRQEAVERAKKRVLREGNVIQLRKQKDFSGLRVASM